MQDIEQILSTSNTRLRYIEQNEASECGLACIAMVASAHNYQIDLRTLRTNYSMSLKGATLKQIIEIADGIGFNARPLRGEVSDVSELALPAIIHWDLNHFVVLAKLGKRLGKYTYEIYDPAKGVYKVDRSDFAKRWTGIALEISKSSAFVPRVQRQDLKISQLWSSMSGFAAAAWQVLTLSVVLQCVALISPFYLQSAIDSALPSSDHILLISLAAGFGGLAIVNLATSWLRSLVLLRINSLLSYQIIVNLFRHLMHLPLSWFEKRHVGDIVSRFSSTAPISQFLSGGIVAALIDAVMALVTLLLMFLYSSLLSALALLAVALYAILRIVFFQVLKLRNISMISAGAAEQTSFIESIRGISAIKSSGNEAGRQRIWQQKKVTAVNTALRLGTVSIGFDAVGQFILAIERVVFVYVAISLAMDGKFTVGMIFAFQAYKQQFIDAAFRIIGQIVSFRVLQVHLSRISDIALSRKEGSSLDGGVIEKIDTSGDIRLRGISFRYGAGEPEVLSDVSLHIKSGEMIALVGPSGGGKTTLLKILMGLYEPTAGYVSIGDIKLNIINSQSFRKQIGSISQGDALFAGSIADNISFFDSATDMNRVIEVCKLSGIDNDISKMPLKYETLVGDMGSVLSGGQKQRVLFARCLYNNPSIVFMDEGTANLDQESEDHVISSLERHKATRIIVAHRPAAIQASERVFYVANGKVREVSRNTDAIPNSMPSVPVDHAR